MENFVEFICPNTPYKNSAWLCNGEMGGISVDTITTIGEHAGVYSDIRYCGKCRVFWQITIASLGAAPVFKMIERTPNEKNIPFVKFLSTIQVFGSKILKGLRGG